MDLTFNKEGKNFVAEFEAKADFNLHIERNKGGDILLYVRTQGGGYDIVDDFGVQRHQGVIDYDCTALVYPKWIKIVSEVEPTYAAVVSDGEVTEIKAQSKEIEVTTNGTTEVTPDAGFAYLNSVKVKTNVAQSGEGGGSASSMEYYDVSAEEFSLCREFAIVGSVVKVREDGGVIIAPTMMALISGQSIDTEKLMNVVAFGANPTTKIVGGVFGDAGIELPEAMGGDELWNKMPRITEEEFYNLNVPA